MRFVAAICLALVTAAAHAERILLIPLDSRPAAGQFAQMISRIAGVEVQMPPYEDLGRFTDPGRPDAILDWLEMQDLSDVSTVIASADMVQYGGLIESRINHTSAGVATARIRRLSQIVRTRPAVRLYVFSATMRLLPTATRQASKYRLRLGSYEEAKAKWEVTRDRSAQAEARRILPTLPSREVEAYEATRRRNAQVQAQLIRMQAAHRFDYLVIGQDDARPFGPHVGETETLKKLTSSLGIGGSVFFCEGVDQHASVLVSRALLTESGWQPKIRIVYSDPDGRHRFASFESKPIQDSLYDQIIASGARPARPQDEYDYTLYLNTPQRREDRFREFLAALKTDLDQGFPTAVADIDLSYNGTADPELFNGLLENARMMKLLSFAGWNTAGNTMGTTIPAANIYLLARRLNTSAQEREVAQREFLLHRFVNDYAFHKYTRPKAYKMIRASRHGTLEEITGRDYQAVNDFVRTDVEKHLNAFFKDQFLGRRFFAGTEEFAFTGLSDIRIFLPWPRAYEVRIEFHLESEPVTAASLEH